MLKSAYMAYKPLENLFFVEHLNFLVYLYTWKLMKIEVNQQLRNLSIKQQLSYNILYKYNYLF